MKAKLRGQALVQKKRCFIQKPHCVREQRAPISETISLPAQASGSSRDRKGRERIIIIIIFLFNWFAVFWCPIHLSSQPFGCLDPVYSYFQLLVAQALSIHIPSMWCPQALPITISSFWRLQAFSTHISIFWCAQCKNLPLHHFGQLGGLPSAPLLSTITTSVFSHNLKPIYESYNRTISKCVLKLTILILNWK